MNTSSRFYHSLAIMLALYATTALMSMTAVALASDTALLTPRDAAELWIAYVLLSLVFWQRWTITRWLRAPLAWLVSLRGWDVLDVEEEETEDEPDPASVYDRMERDL